MGVSNTLLKQLLPPGPAFAALPGSNLDKLLSALSEEIERVRNSASGLISEANPVSMTQMLQIRREECGLPDPCRGEPDTFEEKRKEVVSKWLFQGGATLKFLNDICKLYNYDVNITDGPVGSHEIHVTYLNSNTKYFRAGQSTTGEALQVTNDAFVHCLINRIRPAHVLPIYTGVDVKTW